MTGIPSLGVPSPGVSNPGTPIPSATEPVMNKTTETTDNKSGPHGGSSGGAAKKPPLRVGTMVWGATVLVLGVLLITVRQAGLVLDAGQTAIWLLLGTGVAMIASGVVHLLRRK